MTSGIGSRGFEVICEIQPPTRPDLMRVRQQIGVMSRVADAFVLAAWRERVNVTGKIYAGVLVPPSAARARKWAHEIPEVDVPEEWIEALDQDAGAGIKLACQLVSDIAGIGGFDGVHLIPGVRHQEVAAQLEPLLVEFG